MQMVCGRRYIQRGRVVPTKTQVPMQSLILFIDHIERDPQPQDTLKINGPEIEHI